MRFYSQNKSSEGLKLRIYVYVGERKTMGRVFEAARKMKEPDAQADIQTRYNAVFYLLREQGPI